MVDNVGYTPGEGATVRSDDIGDGHIRQVVRIDAGTDNSELIVRGGQRPMAESLPVVLANDQSPVQVAVASAALPAGAATQATLQAILDAFHPEDSPSISGDLGVLALAMRQIADTTSTDADGDYTAFKVDEEGRLKVATKPASYTPTVGSITTNGGIVWLNCSRASNIVFSMAAASLVGHNASFEVSNDTTNGTDGNWYQMQAIRTNANTIELNTGVLTGTPVYGWEVSVNGWNAFRVRATAHTSGAAAYLLQPGSYATEPIPGAQISGTQPVSVSSGTVSPLTVAGTSVDFLSTSARIFS